MSSFSNDSNKVIFFDTTSRDGKQSPGCNHTPDDTVTLARQLVKLKIDIMEAGFPIASDANFESVSRVCREVPIRTCALARAKDADIERAAKALEKAIMPPRIHTFIASSDIHMDRKLRMTPDEVIQAASHAIDKALSYVDDVEFSPEDSARTGYDFLKRIVRVAAESGAKTINIPDTVGYAVGEEYGSIIAALFRDIPILRVSGVVVSVHCHNDLGLAVANSLAGLQWGARQIEGTVNGIGERAGNTHYAEVALALLTRKDYFKLDVDINTQEIGPTARLLSTIIGKPIPATLPVVGPNVFAHSAGIHQDGVLKERSTYEIMTPELVGWKGESFPLSSQSGRHGLKKRLSEIGYTFDPEDLNVVYQKFTSLADTKVEVHNSDLHMLVQEVTAEKKVRTEHWVSLDRVDYHKIEGRHSATVHLACNGNTFAASGSGDGPADATWDAIKKALDREDLWPGEIQLVDFDIRKGQGGFEAVGFAQVKIRFDGKVGFGRGSDTDIIEAAAKAAISAINHLNHAPIEEAKTTLL